MLVVGQDIDPAPSTRVTCPHTGLDVYGQVPAIAAVANRHDAYAAGPIVLLYGKHIGYHNGYGLDHVWKQHFPRCKDLEEARDQVCAFLRQSMIATTPIHYDRGRGQEKRLLVCSARRGTVILEVRALDYSIVTAIPGAQPKGIAIASLLP